ncbi:MAG: hypothetical protein JW867_02720 [Candidatus Omnitrophica bacterium]|nr:hypothetical protein [Candidatus Omnitrophota bacterium]
MRKVLSLIFINSLFYLSCQAQGLRDIKPPVYFKSYFFRATLIFLLVSILAAIMTAIFLFLKRKKTKPLEPAVSKTADEIAYEALEALKQKNLIARGLIKDYYYELSSIVRYYLENRFSYRCPEMTTEEFLYVLKGSDYLNSDQKAVLSEFLMHCDLVKFAKYGPSHEEIENTYNWAIRLIDETKTRISAQEELNRKS